MRHHLWSHYNDSVRVSQYIPTQAISNLESVCTSETERRGEKSQTWKNVQTIKTFTENRIEEKLYLPDLTFCWIVISVWFGFSSVGVLDVYFFERSSIWPVLFLTKSVPKQVWQISKAEIFAFPTSECWELLDMDSVSTPYQTITCFVLQRWHDNDDNANWERGTTGSIEAQCGFTPRRHTRLSLYFFLLSLKGSRTGKDDGSGTPR